MRHLQPGPLITTADAISTTLWSIASWWSDWQTRRSLSEWSALWHEQIAKDLAGHKTLAVKSLD